MLLGHETLFFPEPVTLDNGDTAYGVYSKCVWCKLRTVGYWGYVHNPKHVASQISRENTRSDITNFGDRVCRIHQEFKTLTNIKVRYAEK